MTTWATLLRVDDFQIELVTDERRHPRRRRRLLLHRPRRDRHHHRRVRLRKVDHRDGHAGAAARRPRRPVGTVRFNGADMLGDRRRCNKVRGRHIALIPQDPMTALSPVHTVGSQLREAVRAQRCAASKATDRAVRRTARAGAHPRSGEAAGEVPAPALRRHAAARADRGRAGRRPGTDRRRRADQRTRRHRAGRHPRPAAGTAGDAPASAC